MLTKDKADGRQGQGRAGVAATRGRRVAKKYSIDDTSKAAGGKLPAQAKGTLDKELDDAVFSAKKNELVGPIKTQYGYYVFTRQRHHRRPASRRSPRPRRRSSRRSSPRTSRRRWTPS